MLEVKKPTETNSWKKLQDHFNEISTIQIKDHFGKDHLRFDKLHSEWNNFLIDFSKNRIASDTFQLFEEFAREMRLSDGIGDMLSGKRINKTEKRAVLHTALRNFSDKEVFVDGENVMPQIKSVLAKMRTFSENILNGEIKGYSGRKIEHVVNIGIGGSDLGPYMVTEALTAYKTRLQLHFVSNVDGSHLGETLKKLNPETTLFIVASKSFTTQETMTNAFSAREWFLSSGASTSHIANHFIALSTNQIQVEKFGIDKENMFEFWDWVGGRYSLWSAIGLSICLGIGFENFENLLHGAYLMDQHLDEERERSIPAKLAYLGIWYNNFFGADSHALLPYNQYLHRFAAYFQQADMESNGKQIDKNGNRVNYQTGPIIWGEAGTNGQHAFYQLIHQGTKLIPADFIGFAKSNLPMVDHHNKLMANFFAQPEALMNGKSIEEVKIEMLASGKTQEEINELAPFKVFEGNKPTNSILIDKLSPKSLGSLIAMYEHKIFIQGYLWNIHSFDQWGVELGKQLAKTILPELVEQAKVKSHDSSTNGLINAFKAMQVK